MMSITLGHKQSKANIRNTSNLSDLHTVDTASIDCHNTMWKLPEPTLKFGGEMKPNFVNVY